MKSWEFLIQQEGDRAWHSIDTPSLEIPPGNYRIMAHTHRTNTDIDVRIVWKTHDVTETHHHSQQLTRRTNEEGLVMILPFSELCPGIWEIRCCGDIFSELLGQVWQEKLSLHVLSASAALPVTLNQEMSQENRTNMNHSASDAQYYLKQLEQLLRQEIEPKLNDSPSDVTPDNPTSQLTLPIEGEDIAGEVSVETADAAVPQATPVSYTIELFSTEADASYTFDFQVSETKTASPLSLALPCATHPLPIFRTASGQVLPPKLDRAPTSAPKTKKVLKLPQFSASMPVNSTEQQLSSTPSQSASPPVNCGSLEDRFLASLNQLT